MAELSQVQRDISRLSDLRFKRALTLSVRSDADYYG